MQEAARTVAKVQSDCKCEVDVEETVEKISPDAMEVCYAWTQGKSFVEVRHKVT